MADLEREGAAEKAWWSCEIGPIDRAYLPWGADRPMREAVQRAYLEVTGKNAEWCASGWGRPIGDATEDGVTARVEARYRALVKAARPMAIAITTSDVVSVGHITQEQGEALIAALAALSENGEEAKT